MDLYSRITQSVVVIINFQEKVYVRERNYELRNATDASNNIFNRGKRKYYNRGKLDNFNSGYILIFFTA